MDRSIRIVLVDDHPVVRAGIARIIEYEPDMMIVGEYNTAGSALKQLDVTSPDVVLMDLRLPGMSGLEAIRRIQASHPHIRTLVLTTYEGDEDILQALKSGAAGYLIKGMDFDRLIKGIRNVSAGSTYVPAELKDVVNTLRPTELSPREREVLRLMADGKGNREIARELFISEATVKSHVGVIFAHFQVKDRTQAVLMALRRGYARL